MIDPVDPKFEITKTTVLTKSHKLAVNWTVDIETMFTGQIFLSESFPNKTIKSVDETDKKGVYLPRCSADDFHKYTDWCKETFGQYGGVLTINASGKQIFFSNEKYRSWFLLKWG